MFDEYIRNANKISFDFVTQAKSRSSFPTLIESIPVFRGEIVLRCHYKMI